MKPVLSSCTIPYTFCLQQEVSALRTYCFARGNDFIAFIFTVLTVVKVLRDQSGLDYRIATIQLNVTGQLKNRHSIKLVDPLQFKAAQPALINSGRPHLKPICKTDRVNIYLYISKIEALYRPHSPSLCVGVCCSSHLNGTFSIR